MEFINKLGQEGESWVAEHMPNGACFVHSPRRGLAFAIPEPLVMAVFMLLSGAEPYTSSVALECEDGLDEDGVLWNLCIGDLVIRMDDDQLVAFGAAFEEPVM